MSDRRETSLHPCFNIGAKGSCGRVHLPVAPKCNLRCNYCNRKYDCANESRPGVTSGLLSPSQAVEYLSRVLAEEPRISVAGIAGPGDPLANPQATLETMRLIREEFPELRFCAGLSNISFGLPARRIINRTFLVLALAEGLDAAIIDPTDSHLYAAILATELLLNRDNHCRNYTRSFRLGRIV